MAPDPFDGPRHDRWARALRRLHPRIADAYAAAVATDPEHSHAYLVRVRLDRPEPTVEATTWEDVATPGVAAMFERLESGDVPEDAVAIVAAWRDESYACYAPPAWTPEDEAAAGGPGWSSFDTLYWQSRTFHRLVDLAADSWSEGVRRDLDAAPDRAAQLAALRRYMTEDDAMEILGTPPKG